MHDNAKLEALKRLEPLIENGTAKSADFAVAFTGIKNDYACWSRIAAERAYHGALSAAYALLDGLLPEYWCDLYSDPQSRCATIGKLGAGVYIAETEHNRGSALLLAVVRALIAKEDA